MTAASPQPTVVPGDTEPPAAVSTLPNFLGGRWTTWAAPVLGVAFWIVVPVVCLVSLVIGTDRVAHHLNSVPSGVKGGFYVTSHTCQRQLCITSGTFTSDDGRIVVRNLLGAYRWPLGTTHRAVYNPAQIDVIPLPAKWDPTPTVVGMAGAIAFLTLWVLCARDVRRRRGAASLD